MSNPFGEGYQAPDIKTNQAGKRVLYGDSETTGFNPFSNTDPHGDRIIEIGFVEYIDGKPTGNNYHVYVDPQRDIPIEAIEVHGLTNEKIEQLSGGKVFADIADSFIDYVRGATVVIHNAEFDVKFFNAELKAIGMPSFEESVSVIKDSLLVARKRYPGKSNTLDALRRRLGVTTPRELHGALLDSQILGEVYTLMTIRQSDLAIDEAKIIHSVEKISRESIDPRVAAALKTVRANAEELKQHDDMASRLSL